MATETKWWWKLIWAAIFVAGFGGMTAWVVYGSSAIWKTISRMGG